MPAWVIVATCYGALVALALARVARRQLSAARALETLREVERDILARARPMTVVGAPGTRVALGSAQQLESLLIVEAAGFELRGADGAITTIVRGVALRVLVRDAAVADGVATLPAGMQLLYAAGDPVFLCEEGAAYFANARLPRETAWPRVAAFVAVPAAIVALCALAGPEWNALAWAGLVALAADQTIGRGIASWGVCTRSVVP